MIGKTWLVLGLVCAPAVASRAQGTDSTKGTARKVVHNTHVAVDKGAKDTKNAVVKAAKDTKNATVKGAKDTGKAIVKGARATKRAAKKLVRKDTTDSR